MITSEKEAIKITSVKFSFGIRSCYFTVFKLPSREWHYFMLCVNLDIKPYLTTLESSWTFLEKSLH